MDGAAAFLANQALGPQAAIAPPAPPAPAAAAAGASDTVAVGLSLLLAMVLAPRSRRGRRVHLAATATAYWHGVRCCSGTCHSSTAPDRSARPVPTGTMVRLQPVSNDRLALAERPVSTG